MQAFVKTPETIGNDRLFFVLKYRKIHMKGDFWLCYGMHRRLIYF